MAADDTICRPPQRPLPEESLAPHRSGVRQRRIASLPERPTRPSPGYRERERHARVLRRCPENRGPVGSEINLTNAGASAPLPSGHAKLGSTPFRTSSGICDRHPAPRDELRHGRSYAVPRRSRWRGCPRVAGAPRQGRARPGLRLDASVHAFPPAAPDRGAAARHLDAASPHGIRHELQQAAQAAVTPARFTGAAVARFLGVTTSVVSRSVAGAVGRTSGTQDKLISEPTSLIPSLITEPMSRITSDPAQLPHQPGASRSVSAPPRGQAPGRRVLSDSAPRAPHRHGGCPEVGPWEPLKKPPDGVRCRTPIQQAHSHSILQSLSPWHPLRTQPL